MAVKHSQAIKFISIVFAVWLLGTLACSAASTENVTVRHIGHIHSSIALRILSQVHIVPLSFQHDSPILLQGKTILRLHERHKHELKATYRAGHSIVLLDATLGHIQALHAIIGEGVSYRSKDTGTVLAYALRRENFTPTATLLTSVDPSPLQTPSGDPDPTGLQDQELALSRVVDRTVAELTHIPHVSVPGQPRDPNGPVDWLSTPVQTITFAINSPQGVYNTGINVFALFRCLD